MLDVLLYQPEIPPNTGNIMRLCVNTGARLHLIAPLGFELDDAKLRRAGLDYGDWSDVTVHASLDAAIRALAPPRLLALTTKASQMLPDFHFQKSDALLFGPETRGLPDAVLQSIPNDARLRIPMRPNSRSLNLSNAVAVVVYEAWRQFGYGGAC
ncbi:MAG TPA: tRNA (cytidine(34)-2'-O)-methyltransferase [Pseudomonadales bacterium]|nr:tRNA (cytidine(34)-2'-O)-methyltransferase [Pseudomonadales bacterium]